VKNLAPERQPAPFLFVSFSFVAQKKKKRKHQQLNLFYNFAPQKIIKTIP
jgi:hypothetical protein